MHSCKVQVHSISTDKALLLNSQPPTLKTWLQCSQTSHHPRHKIKSLNERTSFVIALLDCTFLEKKTLTLSGHHCSSSPRETGLWTGILFLSRLGSPSRLVEPRSVSNEAPSSHRRSRNLNTDSRSRNSSESRSKGRRRTGMQ